MWTLGAALTAFLLWAGYAWYERRKDAELTQWQQKVKILDDSLLTARATAARADTLYMAGKTVYLAGRDRILHDTLHPPSPEVKACYDSADKLISACEIRHRADSLVIAQQGSKITLLENKPSGVQRVQAFGEAMYDVAHQVPVIRAGATAKVFGPVSLSVAGEYAAPTAGLSSPAFRALAGVRITF